MGILNWLHNLSGKAHQAFLATGAAATLVMGTPGTDVVSDTGKANEAVYAKEGNDVMVYTPSLNRNKHDIYDGGAGLDTLWIRMSPAEYDDPKFRADLIALHFLILNTADLARGDNEGPSFKFQSFNLEVRNVEYVIIERINSRDTEFAISKPAFMNQIRDSSRDSSA